MNGNWYRKGHVIRCPFPNVDWPKFGILVGVDDTGYITNLLFVWFCSRISKKTRGDSLLLSLQIPINYTEYDFLNNDKGDISYIDCSRLRIKSLYDLQANFASRVKDEQVRDCGDLTDEHFKMVMDRILKSPKLGGYAQFITSPLP